MDDQTVFAVTRKDLAVALLDNGMTANSSNLALLTKWLVAALERAQSEAIAQAVRSGVVK